MKAAGRGAMGAGEKERAGTGRGGRWAEERSELMSEVVGGNGRGGFSQAGIAALGMANSATTSSRRPLRTDPITVIRPSPTGGSGRSRPANHISAMDVDAPDLYGAIQGQADVPMVSRVIDCMQEIVGGSQGLLARDKSPLQARAQLIAQGSVYGQEGFSQGPGNPVPIVQAPEESVEHGQSRMRQKLRNRGQSPRRIRVEEDDLQDVLAEIIHDQSLTLARAARKQLKSHKQGSKDTKEAGQESRSGRGSPSLRPGVGDSHEENLVKGARRAKPRRQKRKADAVHESLPDVALQQTQLALHPLQGLQQIVSIAPTRTGARSMPIRWMRFDALGDVIMWRDVPRSSLFFGAGCFFMLSASFLQDFRCGLLSFTAYIALVYLGAVFLHQNFLRGASSAETRIHWELSESEAFELVRVTLPTINLALRKFGQLFCGEPSTTLKVASVLWLLAQAGYFMTLWSLARSGHEFPWWCAAAFVLMFIIPKLYSSYSHQLHWQAEAHAHHLWTAWNAYSHKKIAMFGTFLFAWNFSSSASRLYGAFLLLVTVKLYSRYLAEQANNQTEVDQSLPVSEQPQERLTTPPLTPPLLCLKNSQARKV